MYSSGFLSVSSHYLILPRVSSLVVQGNGDSAPTSKAQGLISGFAWFCVFFSAGQVLLSTLSWCSVCICVSEVVFLMYPWREMHSTYSSIILFSSVPPPHTLCFLLSLCHQVAGPRGLPAGTSDPSQYCKIKTLSCLPTFSLSLALTLV